MTTTDVIMEDAPAEQTPFETVHILQFHPVGGVFEARTSMGSAMSDKMELEDNPDKLRKRMSMRMHLKTCRLHDCHA
ncbi:hypothetical protein KIN20_031949 [Parelaphostrongylus tenuis]|uniref:Uncharacterized protein n=1 Tax=Parelaphostrongylus tenuis TaxID=148309 RepID=A0AAD5R684_PARTN|nr:hypothetical protein KIN20_031949 [Parelaphostrongylus tenuis]